MPDRYKNHIQTNVKQIIVDELGSTERVTPTRPFIDDLGSEHWPR